jgi:hypothetical protein
MATAHTAIRKLEFLIKDELTICNLFYESDEPGTPWGGGWKTKTFPPSINVVEFINKEVPDYLYWPDGREGVEEKQYKSTAIYGGGDEGQG